MKYHSDTSDDEMSVESDKKDQNGHADTIDLNLKTTKVNGVKLK